MGHDVSGETEGSVHRDDWTVRARAGGTAPSAPAASAARYMQEQKPQRLRSTEGRSSEQNRKNLVRFLRAVFSQVPQEETAWPGTSLGAPGSLVASPGRPA